MGEPSITDWISAIASLGGMVIAAITAYVAYREYLKPPVQLPDPQSAEAASANVNENELQVFNTSKQRTLPKSQNTSPLG